MTKLKYLVIHTSDTPYDREITAQMIRDWHLSPKPKGRGWKQVGYSDLIQRSGKLVNLVPYNLDDNVDKWEITNGAAGVNSISRHVVLAGGWNKDGSNKNGHAGKNLKPTDKIEDLYTKEQIETLAQYVKKQLEDVPTLKVVGHYYFGTKTCPNFDVEDFLKRYVNI